MLSVGSDTSFYNANIRFFCVILDKNILQTVTTATDFFINPFRMVIIGLIGAWMNCLVVDYFTAAPGNRKCVCIVPKEYGHIRKYIVAILYRGCTLYEVVGGYSGEKSIELEVLLGKDEFSQLLAWLKQEQISAFTTANNVSEVYGLWFSTKKRKQLEEEMKRR